MTTGLGYLMEHGRRAVLSGRPSWELLGLRPTVPGDEDHSGPDVVRIETVRDPVGFPHNVADGTPALMVEDHALVRSTLSVPLVGNLQQVGICGEQRPAASDRELKVLDVGNGPEQASLLRREHIDATSSQPVDNALIDVLVCVECNHALARFGAYRPAMRKTNSSSARSSASTSSWLS